MRRWLMIEIPDLKGSGYRARLASGAGDRPGIRIGENPECCQDAGEDLPPLLGELNRVLKQVLGGGQTELLLDVGAMGLDGLDAEIQPLADLL